MSELVFKSIKNNSLIASPEFFLKAFFIIEISFKAVEILKGFFSYIVTFPEYLFKSAGIGCKIISESINICLILTAEINSGDIPAYTFNIFFLKKFRINIIR